MSSETIVSALLVGRPEPFGPGERRSAIRKRPVEGAVSIGAGGLAGDDQADKKNHGGRDQAVHHYPFDHYAMWRQAFREAAEAFGEPGFFGENVSTLGMTESEVCIGDRYRLGTAVLEVSQAREPCWKLAFRVGEPRFAERVQETGATGWFYRVVEPGTAAAGTPLELLERPCPEWPLARLLAGFYGTPLDQSFLREMAGLEPLSPRWREKAAKRLDTKKIEPWHRRLTIPGG